MSGIMTDEMDVYLGRCIKNWASMSQSPSDGRRQLMKAAALLPVQEESWVQNLFHTITHRFTCASYNFNTYENWHGGSFTQSPTWYFHVSLNWRTAT
jgi:hypothetical protein